MAGEEERGFTKPCYLILATVVLEGFFAAQFGLTLEFWYEQLPAMCIDGRLNNDSLVNISFSIDDTSEYRGEVSMTCKVPVHIYPCPDAQAGFCRDSASAVPLPTARVSELETGLTCIRESSSFSLENVCKHRDFTCATGPCTAYEKAGRLCAANMISPTWYECYYIPSADIPVRTVHTSFPTFGLLLLLMSILIALWFLAVRLHEIMDKCEVGVKGFLPEMAATCVGLSCIIILAVVWGSVLQRHARGEQTVNMTQFDVEVGPDGQVVLPEEEPISEVSVGWGFSILCAICCGVPCCLLALSRCKTESAVKDEDKDELLESQRQPTV